MVPETTHPGNYRELEVGRLQQLDDTLNLDPPNFCLRGAAQRLHKASFQCAT